MVRKISELLIGMILFLSTTGCFDQRIYERIAFIVNVGIDTDSDGKLLVTITYPVTTSSESNGSLTAGGSSTSTIIPIDVINTKANLLREAREISNEISPRRLEGGKIQNVLVGRNLAELGLQDYLEIFERDPKNPVLAWVIVVDGSANELIDKRCSIKNKPPLGIYINQLVDDNSKAGYCPAETIIDFNVESTIPGIDPLATMVKPEVDGIRVTGSALFHMGKLTGQLDTQETAHLMIMKGIKKQSMIYFNPPDNLSGLKKKAVLSVQGVKSKMKIKIIDDVPEVSFDIKLAAGLEEYKFYSFLSEGKKNELAAAAQEQIRQKMQEVFEKLKKAGCDTLGIGVKVHAYRNDYWNRIGGKEGWELVYSKVKAKFNVEVKINNYGRLK